MRTAIIGHFCLAVSAAALIVFSAWSGSHSMPTGQQEETTAAASPTPSLRLLANPAQPPRSWLASASVSTRELLSAYASTAQFYTGPDPIISGPTPTVPAPTPSPTPISPDRLRLLEQADLNGDGVIDAKDLLLLMSVWQETVPTRIQE